MDGLQWRRWKASSSSVYTSLSICNGTPTETVWWRRRNSTSSTSGGRINLAWSLRPSQTFTDVQLRASCQAVSLPGMATALPATTGLSRWWCGLPNTSLGAHCLPYRPPTAPDVTWRPKRSSRTSTIRATTCSPRYHPDGKVSTGASKLGPREWKTASISRTSDC